MTAGALSDLKVVELGTFFSAAYCSKLLADLGADVIKVEPPQGDSARRHGPFPNDVPHPERSGLFLYLNTNKRGITVDVSTPSGRSILLELVRWADVLIENLGPRRIDALALPYEELARANPALLMTSISPFGLTGPYREYAASDLVAFHMGGYGRIVGGPVENPNAEPPVKAAEYQADFVAAVNAAGATLAGVFARRRSGEGAQIDVSMQEAMIPFVFGEVGRYAFTGRIQSRNKVDNPANGVVVILPTSDGHVAISPREEHLWARWLEVMGNPEWARDERFKDRPSRTKHWAQVEPLLAEWTVQHTKDEVFRAAQAARVPSFPVNTMESIFESPQLRAREFFKRVEHPEAGCFLLPTAPYRFSSTPWQLRLPAPLLGEHNEEILCGRLGHGKEDLVKLRQAGIV